MPVAAPQLMITAAYYGPQDVTANVQSRVNSNSLFVEASNSAFGDPSPGVVKVLVVFYRFGNMKICTEMAREGSALNISFYPSVHSFSYAIPTTPMLTS
jgi:hypothetical protein